MPAPLFPGINPQFCDAEGIPVAAGRLYSFVAGTDTPQPTYSDVDLAIANSNPILLNAAGQSPTAMYLVETGYKFRLDTPAGVPLWTTDLVPGLGTAVPLATTASPRKDQVTMPTSDPNVIMQPGGPSQPIYQPPQVWPQPPGWGGNYPSQGLPGGGYPSQGLPGGPNYPSQGPIYGGGYPSQGLPGAQPGPDQGLPGGPTYPSQGPVWGGNYPSQGLPGFPSYPSQGLPGFPPYPSHGLPGGGYPSHPIAQPPVFPVHLPVYPDGSPLPPIWVGQLPTVSYHVVLNVTVPYEDLQPPTGEQPPTATPKK